MNGHRGGRTTVVLFTRDLRVHDHPALAEAAAVSERVVPLFVLDDSLLGVGRDGRTLHWQGMPWDLTSNWSEEDRRAMLAYLRALPPVPEPRPPRVDDPVADTFGFGDRAIR